ncbi:diacylglycerol lipase-beta isoform X3 [Carya illinoinensis]|uniref:diacylglycerol lipase-beta isoform X3 n=1 Tax=Carya illinoinensis TaxID=32201 RepID=UPI001C71F907|nr:diacylglycerol lipase-beta isoform X3 [Carya illinoinensis]
MWVPVLKNLTWAAIILGLSNAVVVLLGAFLVILAYPSCDHRYVFPFVAVSFAAGVRIVAMVPSGIAQEATAMTILESPSDNSAGVVDAVLRLERRMRYKKWLWWTRFATVITVLQFVGATYLMFHMAKYISHPGSSSNCVLGIFSNGSWWKPRLLALFMIMACLVALVQCFAGSDVVNWRSYYATKDNAWKAHYLEVFDNGMREALCCLGRVRYLSVLEEDEVYSVARLLGDLVAYRASGTGHLELLAGLALLQRHGQSPRSFEDSMEAPDGLIQEAAALHKFAEAAYTGPLLDFGRNPFLFPCAWLYRQGLLAPWARNRWPILDGDNWWRGHAAAFLKHVNLTPEVLRRGRVNQAKCEAAYFIVVLHHLRSVVVAVRGTETPEDLITDGLCKECILSAEDLHGLMNSSHVHPDVKLSVESSFPHYGHSGILGAAQDLFRQIDGNPGDYDAECKSSGFLSSLLGAGCECDGYDVRIVGHSLGGAIAALLGIKLYRRYRNLHVFAYGPLPCVDAVVADACSEFVTSIVYDNEFSARLSFGSILRLRAAAITALSQDTKTDKATIFRLARRFLNLSVCQRSGTEVNNPASDVYHGAITGEDLNHQVYERSEGQCRVFPLWNEADKDGVITMDHSEFTHPFSSNVDTFDNPISQFMETVPRSESRSARDPPEMYPPGLVIHIVPQQRSLPMSMWKACTVHLSPQNYKAYIANRESFKDIIVSPSMFLDHLPWRCRYAMKNVLEARSAQGIRNESYSV